MTFTQSAALRDREYAKFESVQPGSVVAVNIYNPIRKYTFEPAALIAIAKSGTVLAYSSHALNGEIKRVSVDIGNWTATGSLWIRQSGTTMQPPILTIVSGTKAFGGKQPFYPADYPSATTSGTGVTTAIGIGSPNVMYPLVINDKVVVVGSGLTALKSGLGIVIEYR